MNIAIFHSVWTLVILLVVVGIIAWAYDSRRKQAFDAASRIPLDDDDAVESSPNSSKETNHA